MADTTRTYFEQAEMWSGDHPAAVTILEAVQALVPHATGSLLDLGCGDGALTNRLRGVPFVVGGDISVSALRHVVAPRVCFSADRLPFRDDAFDVVIATDVIEHLPDDLLAGAWREIVRVARRAVVIAVPFREPVDYFRVTCAACGEPYHAHGHLRRYDTSSFDAVDGLHVVEIALAGPRWTYGVEVGRLMRDITATSYDFPYAICLHCGAAHRPEPVADATATAIRRFDALQYMRCEHGIDAWPPPSEIVVLLAVDADEPGASRADAGAVTATVTDDMLHGSPPEASERLVFRLDESHRRSDPEHYASEWGWIADQAGDVLVTLPRRPARATVIAGHIDEVAVYDSVHAVYVPIDAARGGDGGAPVLRAVRPGPAGYLLRLVGADADTVELAIELDLTVRAPGELAGVAFGDELSAMRLERAVAAAADASSQLNELADRHAELVARYEQTWDELQEMAAAKEALNTLAEQLESKRALLENLLSQRS